VPKLTSLSFMIAVLGPSPDVLNFILLASLTNSLIPLKRTLNILEVSFPCAWASFILRSEYVLIPSSIIFRSPVNLKLIINVALSISSLSVKPASFKASFIGMGSTSVPSLINFPSYIKDLSPVSPNPSKRVSLIPFSNSSLTPFPILALSPSLKSNLACIPTKSAFMWGSLPK